MCLDPDTLAEASCYKWELRHESGDVDTTSSPGEGALLQRRDLQGQIIPNTF